MIRKAYRRFGWWLIGKLIKHFKWHNAVLDTHAPNVPFLKVKSMTVVNGYGQERVIR